MGETDNWLTRYEESHSDLRNPVVYWAAVPMIVFGTVGYLWSLPIPAEFFDISPLLNWGSAFLMVAAIYYFIISLSLAIGLLPFLVGLAAIQVWLLSSPYPASAVSMGLIAAGLAGLLLGRGGSLRAVFQDVQMMMIGPAWLLSRIYRRFGIPV
ncbi:MAG: hypothetical protein K0U72_07020 [Gammaproteobacteria bacterium]|nr:hypothetical protein [Gammaproteobacteria bacterium]